jgi:hypothetical protein
MKKLLITITLLLLASTAGAGGNDVECLLGKTGESCTIAMVSTAPGSADVSIWTNQAAAEGLLPIYSANYAPGFASDRAYRYCCTCTGGTPVWCSVYTIPETRVDAAVSPIKAQTDQLVFANNNVNANATVDASTLVVLPVMQGKVAAPTFVQSKPIQLISKTTPTLTFDFGTNYSGWTVYFGMKNKITDTAYIVSPKTGTWIDNTKGQGYVTLSSTDTATPGNYAGELLLINGASRLPAIEYNIQISKGVIDAIP